MRILSVYVSRIPPAGEASRSACCPSVFHVITRVGSSLLPEWHRVTSRIAEVRSAQQLSVGRPGTVSSRICLRSHTVLKSVINPWPLSALVARTTPSSLSNCVGKKFSSGLETWRVSTNIPRETVNSLGKNDFTFFAPMRWTKTRPIDLMPFQWSLVEPDIATPLPSNSP